MITWIFVFHSRSPFTIDLINIMW